MYQVIMINDWDIIVSSNIDEVALRCRKTTSIIVNHQIPHFLLRFGKYWYLIIDDDQAPFVVLCGLNIFEFYSDNISTPEYINFLFEN